MIKIGERKKREMIKIGERKKGEMIKIGERKKGEMIKIGERKKGEMIKIRERERDDKNVLDFVYCQKLFLRNTRQRGSYTATNENLIND
jgi:hypothetical protein